MYYISYNTLIHRFPAVCLMTVPTQMPLTRSVLQGVSLSCSTSDVPLGLLNLNCFKKLSMTKLFENRDLGNKMSIVLVNCTFWRAYLT